MRSHWRFSSLVGGKHWEPPPLPPRRRPLVPSPTLASPRLPSPILARPHPPPLPDHSHRGAAVERAGGKYRGVAVAVCEGGDGQGDVLHWVAEGVLGGRCEKCARLSSRRLRKNSVRGTRRRNVRCKCAPFKGRVRCRRVLFTRTRFKGRTRCDSRGAEYSRFFRAHSR